MPRSTWKGSISFGLVNIPVALYPGEKHEALDFTMLDKKNMAPVGYKRVNKQSGEEVPYDRIVKGYEYEKDQYVVLSDEELKRANVKATQSVDILEFVKMSEIPFTYFDRPYYLEPMKKIGEKGYVLLRETLKRTGRVGIANVVIRTRQHLALLAPMGDMLVLNLLRYPYELRDTTDINLPRDAKVSDKEIDMAERLVDDMTAKWKPSKYKDEYRDDIMRLVERKIASGKTLEIEEASAGEAPARTADVIDFMSLLKRSVQEKEKDKPKEKEKAPSQRTARRRKPAASERTARRRRA
jgi:DNA end-binding protein Ku